MHISIQRLSFIVLILAVATAYFLLMKNEAAIAPTVRNAQQGMPAEPHATSTDDRTFPSAQVDQEVPESIPQVSKFTAPLERAKERITKKPFGIYITKKTSPVQPEKFSGYHTGVDFEIFEHEEDVDVPVHVICTGPLILKKYATGYGGVAVQSCVIQDGKVTVVYGHLRLSSITMAAGAELQAGDTLGFLGKAYSTETDGERKHLHLGVHKGTVQNIKGYVQIRSELDQWLNSADYL